MFGSAVLGSFDDVLVDALLFSHAFTNTVKEAEMKVEHRRRLGRKRSQDRNGSSKMLQVMAIVSLGLWHLCYLEIRTCLSL